MMSLRSASLHTQRPQSAAPATSSVCSGQRPHGLASLWQPPFYPVRGQVKASLGNRAAKFRIFPTTGPAANLGSSSLSPQSQATQATVWTEVHKPRFQKLPAHHRQRLGAGSS